MEVNVKKSLSLTFLVRNGLYYFGQYDICNVYDVNDNFLMKGKIEGEDHLVVDIDDL